MIKLDSLEQCIGTTYTFYTMSANRRWVNIVVMEYGMVKCMKRNWNEKL